MLPDQVQIALVYLGLAPLLPSIAFDIAGIGTLIDSPSTSFRLGWQ